MDNEQRANNFLQTTREYFDGKIERNQAGNALFNQYMEMSKDGSWRQAFSSMLKQSNHWDKVPNMACEADVDYLHCHVSPSMLDFDADRKKSVDFTVKNGEFTVNPHSLDDNRRQPNTPFRDERTPYD